MFKSLHRFSKDQKGEASADLAISMVLLILLVFGLMMLWPIFSTQMSLSQSTRQITRTIEITGDANDLDHMVEQLAEAQPDSIEIQTEWLDESEKTIQLKTPFTVKAVKEIPITIARPIWGDPIVFYVTLHSSAEGISEVYHK